METLVLHLPSQSYRDLQEQAQRSGKSLDLFTRDILEEALRRANVSSVPESTRDILEAGDRVRSLSPDLKERIISGVMLEEVREMLGCIHRPSLSEVILEQRGPKG